MENPRLLPVFFVFALIFGVGWRKNAAHLTPPQLAAYEWTQHPQALLISYPVDECGCAPLADLVRLGLQNNLDIVVISPK